MARAASSSASPKTLGVLVAERIISDKQARRIAAVQDKLRSNGIEPCPKVGEIGIQNGCLTEASRDKGLERLTVYRADGRTCPDPTSAFRRDFDSAWSLRGGAALGALIVGVAVGTWFITHSVEYTSIAATLVTALVTALNLMAPAVVDGRFLWYRYVRTAAVVAMAVFFVFGNVHVRAMPWPVVVCFNGLALCAFYFCGVSLWRRWENRALDARQYVTRGLIKDAIAGMRNAPTTPEHQTARINMLLTGAVRLLSLNIYGRAAAGAMRWKNPSASIISVWYLRRPSPTSTKLEIHAYACSTVSPEIKAAYDKIWAEHKPACLNKQRFEEVWGECLRRARAVLGEHHPGCVKFALKLFQDQVERPQFVSLAGWVLETGARIFSNDLDKCMAFERGYVDVFDSVPSKTVKQALQFGSAIAYPVGSDGILMALRTIKGGFIAEDEETISEIAESLGAVLGTNALGVEHVK